MRSTLVVAAAFAASVWSLAVQAQENAPVTRADVQADLVRAEQAGLLNQPDPVYPRPMPQQTATAAAPEAAQAVGGARPMSSESGAGSRAVPLVDQVYRGN